MNGNELIAMRNIRNAFDWTIGGYYNAVQDNTLECIPNTPEEVYDEIYTTAMNDFYTGTGAVFYGRAPKEMRFAGTEFIKKYIHELWNEDGDVAEIAEAKGWAELKETYR